MVFEKKLGAPQGLEFTLLRVRVQPHTCGHLRVKDKLKLELQR
jgi:hypothetical protein